MRTKDPSDVLPSPCKAGVILFTAAEMAFPFQPNIVQTHLEGKSITALMLDDNLYIGAVKNQLLMIVVLTEEGQGRTADLWESIPLHGCSPNEHRWQLKCWLSTWKALTSCIPGSSYVGHGAQA